MRLYLIDDEENMVRILAKILRREGYEVDEFTDPRAAIEALELAPPDLVVTDVSMPGLTGMDVLKAVRTRVPTARILLMTAFGTIEGAIQALKEGAFDYISKPFESAELITKVAEALQATPVGAAKIEKPSKVANGGGATNPEQRLASRVLGDSPEMQAVRDLILKVAPTDSSVMINGESGTGKELVARALHDESDRRSGPFVAINCAAVPETLLESELFGHEAGAFTDATAQKIGLFETADGGTLFLDEIGELSPGAQARLLRVLQERTLQRVGGLEPIPVDIRLVAATNRPLEEMLESGAFRSDLFFRLNVILIQLAPLRKRRADIAILANAFAERQVERRGGLAPLPQDIIERLRVYDWPGNARELENVVERLYILAEGGRITTEMLPDEVVNRETDPAMIPEGRNTPLPVNFRDARSQFELGYLISLLEKTGGSVSSAARMSGISRRNLYDKIQKYEIDLTRFKEE